MGATITLEPRYDAIGPAVGAALDALGYLAEVARREGATAVDGDRQILRIALTEALNNVVEHSGHPRDLPLTIEVGADPAEASFTLEDRGRPLPDGLVDGSRPTLPDPTGTSPCAGLPDGGWGWMLIRASVETVHYDRSDGRNRLRLVGCRRAPT